MKRSEYKIGEFLVTDRGNVFIHDGYVNGDGYGCIIGETSEGKVESSSGYGNFQRWPVDHIACDKEKERLIKKIHNTENIRHY